MTTATGYATIGVEMALYGTGMGFTSAPATEAIMGAVPSATASVGSAVNDATRLLGGTLGVAVIGSVYASLYASRLTAGLPSRLPAALTPEAHRSAGAAVAIACYFADTGQPALAAAVHADASSEFIHGVGVACLACGCVAAVAAVIAFTLLPAQPTIPPTERVTELAPVEAATPLGKPWPVPTGAARSLGRAQDASHRATPAVPRPNTSVLTGTRSGTWFTAASSSWPKRCALAE